MSPPCLYCPHMKISRLMEVVITTCIHPSLDPPRQIRVRSRVAVSSPPALPPPDWCPLSTSSSSESPRATRIIRVRYCPECPYLGSFARRVCKKWPYTDENGYELLRPINTYPRIPDWCPLEQIESDSYDK